MFPGHPAFAANGGGAATLTVNAFNAVSKTPLSGIGVKVENITAGETTTEPIRYTNTSGKISYTGLTAGWYRITQVSTLNGYTLNSEPITRYIDSNLQMETVIDMPSSPERALYIQRIDPKTASPLAGATYRIENSTGAVVDTVTTDATGYAIIPHIAAGKYTVTEITAPHGYNKDEQQQVITIVDTEKSPYIIIFSGAQKSSISIFNYDGASGEPISGGVFTLSLADGTVISRNLTTNENGIAYLENLAPGTYIVTQTKTGVGYVEDLKSATVTLGADYENAVVKLSNFKPGNIKVFCGDSVTGEPLAGVSFKLYDQNNNLAAGPATSDADGLVVFQQLADGNYTIVASNPPSGYTMDLYSQMITIRKGVPQQVVFTATAKGSLRINSVDGDSGKALPGTTFQVKKMDDTLIGTYTTESDGSVVVPNLEDGYYLVTETGVPAGYVLVTAAQHTRINKGQISTLTFANRQKPFIIVENYIKGTNIPLEGSTFEVYAENGSRVSTGVSDNHGQVVFPDLEPGVYTVKNSAVPEGYNIVTPSITVTVTKAQAGRAVFTAAKQSSILIQKFDSETAEPLDGAIFQIRNAQGRVLENVTTGADGCAVTGVLPVGKYFVQESFAPKGYVPDTTRKTVEVVDNSTCLANFTNTQKSSIVIYAYDTSGLPLAGVSYAVSNAITGKEVATVITDEAGVAITDVLTPGVYSVREVIVPDGYLLPTTIQMPVSLSAGVASMVRFVHTSQSVIQIQTKDVNTGEAVAGATYQILTMENDFIGEFVADENGEVITGSLEPGTYLVKQTIAPAGYLLNTTTQTIEVRKDQTNNARFFNSPMAGIVIENVDQSRHTPLAGSVFEIYNEAGKQIFHGTTDASGLLNTGALDPGNYTIKQTGTPDGYSIVQAVRTVKVTTTEPVVVVFENVPLTGLYIELLDSVERTGIKGAKFKIEDIEGNYITELTTDEAGIAFIGDLKTGNYMVTQTKAADGYFLVGDYKWAKIVAGADTNLKFVNEKTSGMIIQAVTQDTHEGLSGAVFEIYEENGKLVNTLTSDTTGHIQVGTLQPGSYLVKEVTGPEGYSIVTATQKAKITSNEPTTLTFYHTSRSALSIHVTDSAGVPLEGGVYQVTTGDGAYVGEYTTDRSGTIVIPALKAGSYFIIELHPPLGYTENSTPRSVEIKDDVEAKITIIKEKVTGLKIINTCSDTGDFIAGNQFKVTTVDGTLIGNYTTNRVGEIYVNLEPGEYLVYQTNTADGYKKNKELFNVTVKADVSTTLEVENQAISGITIKLIDAENRKGIYGVELEVKDGKNNSIGRYTTDNEGFVYLSEPLTEGRYKVAILSVPSGYTRDEVPKTIQVETGETTELVWELNGMHGQVVIATYTADDSVMMNIRKNTLINGAIYTITDASGNIVATVSGNINGLAYSGALPLGTYYVQQTTAPNGYLVNDTRVTVNVSEKNKDVRIEVYNKAGKNQSTVEVRGQAIALAGNQLKYYFTNVKNASNSDMENFYLHIKVPTDAVRASTLFTGTWNTPTTYAIEYKTNIRDYQAFVSGLNSQSQYTYDLSSTALGLGVNEYVTDIRFVFSGVVAGFHENMAPTLYTTVLSTLPNGYFITLKTEVGGQVNGAWYTGASQFTSTLQSYLIPGYPNYRPYPWGPNYPVELPNNLPKTGY